MNFADGRVGLTDLVDTNGGRAVDTTFGADVRGRGGPPQPASSQAELERQKDILEGINVSGM